MTESSVIELDWYKDYGIKVIPSKKSGEAYCVNNFKIDEDWGGARKLKENYKAIYHKTFGLLLTLWLTKKILEECGENIEQLYLLDLLGVLNGKSFDPKKFIVVEGANIPIVAAELVEDIAFLNLNDELKKATKGKEIYYFQRAKWAVTERHPFYYNDVVVRVSARFNFLILDK